MSASPSHFRLAGLALAALTLVGCAGTKLNTTWSAPDYRGGPLRKVLVVGLFPDDAERMAFERAFTQRLGKSGVQAAGGAKLLPNPSGTTREEVQQLVEKYNFDGVITGRLTSERQKVRAGDPKYGNLYGFWEAAAPMTDAGGGKEVDVQTLVYGAAGGGKLVWAGESEPFDAKDAEKNVEKVAEKVFEELKKEGLVPEKK